MLYKDEVVWAAPQQQVAYQIKYSMCPKGTWVGTIVL